MTILLLFAFVSGLVTIAAPCIWPLLPVILSSTSTGEKRKPLGITLGIALSFTVFTLSISYLVRLFPIDANIFRLLAVVIIGFLGLTLLIPQLSAQLEASVSRLMSRFGSKLPQQTHGFWGGFVTGCALGLVWSPCAGPILATIAALAATRAVNTEAILVTIVYVTGVSIPLLLFAQLGTRLFSSTSKLNKYTQKIQQGFGVIMILTAVAIYTNYDKTLQAQLLSYFPSYSSFLTKLESNQHVTRELKSISGKDPSQTTGVLSQNSSPSTLKNLGKAPEFTEITQWLNSPPLTLKQLKGKVVLVDFWTYTCINCIRTLPYLTAWDQKYRGSGLVIVGVHTPEFEFEKNTENVKKALAQYHIEYPVAQDNDYGTWNAYQNQYWPAKYLIDDAGNVRYVHFGEGNYEETEKAIQTLLQEAGSTVEQSLTEEHESLPLSRISPETYLGSLRMEYYYPSSTLKNDSYVLDNKEVLPANTFTLAGAWQVTDEYSQTNGMTSSLFYNFRATNVYLVMKTATGQSAHATLLIDGKPITTDQAGTDVINGVVTVDNDRLYHLVKLNSVENHILQIKFDSPGVQAYAFTFG